MARAKESRKSVVQILQQAIQETNRSTLTTGGVKSLAHWGPIEWALQATYAAGLGPNNLASLVPYLTVLCREAELRLRPWGSDRASIQI